MILKFQPYHNFRKSNILDKLKIKIIIKKYSLKFNKFKNKFLF